MANSYKCTKDCKCKKCGCEDSYLTTPLPCPTPPDCPEAQPCSDVFDAKCSVYTGSPILCNNVTIIPTGTSIDQALTNITNLICNNIPTTPCDTCLYEVKLTIGYEQLRTAWSTPVLAIPAPGVGKFIEIVSASEKYNYVDEPFKFNGDTVAPTSLRFNSSPPNDPAFFMTEIGEEFSTHKRGQCYDNDGDIFENEAVSYRVFSNSIIGDSPQGLGNTVVYILYRIVDL
jgi:hypothetical protein